MIDALIPSGKCLHCNEANADINPWVCGGCAVSIQSDDSAGEHLGEYCLTTLYLYQGALQTLLTRAKHPLEPAIYKELLKTEFVLPENACFIPVPTPWHRRFKRRGCQTTCIAQLLANRFAGRVLHALRRRSHHRAQASLSAPQRRQLPATAFKRIRPPPEGPVILVDDITTTGSTLKSAAAALELPQQQLKLFALARVP